MLAPTYSSATPLQRPVAEWHRMRACRACWGRIPPPQQRRRDAACSAASGALGGGADDGHQQQPQQQPQQQHREKHEPQQQQQQQQQSSLGRVRAWLAQGKLDKAKLAEYGLGAFAAYGIVSNVNAGVCVTLAWMTIVHQTGLTPLAPGQWPKFLLAYGGLWLGASVMRPLRLSLALAAAPVFNLFLDRVQQSLKVSRGVAFGALLVLIALFSITFMFTCLLVAGGFPQGLPFIPSLRG